MGHQIEHQVSFGNCQLTQCACGRSALKVRDKVLLLSGSDVEEITRIFGSLGSKGNRGSSELALKLNWLTGGKSWADFSA
jgi:hypothetical protein